MCCYNTVKSLCHLRLFLGVIYPLTQQNCIHIQFCQSSSSKLAVLCFCQPDFQNVIELRRSFAIYECKNTHPKDKKQEQT